MAHPTSRAVSELRGLLSEMDAPVWRPGTPFRQGMALPPGYRMVFGTPREVDTGAAPAPKPAAPAATSPETPADADHGKKKKDPPKFVQPPPGTKNYATPEKLPDEPSKYFDVTPDSVMVPVSSLQTIRARPEGIANAEILMANAFNGFNTKRKPISLKANADGTYTVLDGNSTTAIATKHGWKNIVGKVVEGVEEDTLDGMLEDLRRLLELGEAEAAPEWKPGTPYDAGMALPTGWRLAYGKYPYLPKKPAYPRGDINTLKSNLKGLKRVLDAGHVSGTLGGHIKEAKEFLTQHAKNKVKLGETLESLAPKDAQVSVRVKDLASSLGKIVRKADDAASKGKKSKYDSVKLLGDGTGGRIICKSVQDVLDTVEKLKKQFKVVEEEDSITSPKPGMGYRSIHLNIVDADGLQKELQIRTENQHKHAEWAHDAYKPRTDEQQKIREANAKLIDEYGLRASEHFYGVDTGKKPPPEMPDCPPVIQKTFGCL